MDLLDDLRQKTGNQKAARRKGPSGSQKRETQALLLAWLSSPLKPNVACQRRKNTMAGVIERRCLSGKVSVREYQRYEQTDLLVFNLLIVCIA
jgi:hypothetical protein